LRAPAHRTHALRVPATLVRPFRGTSDAALMGMQAESLLDAILELSPIIRYAALHLGGGEPVLRERAGSSARGASEGERWDELVVNPVLVELASRRGNVDCGGLDFLAVRYRRFFNLVIPVVDGHLSIVLDPDADPLPLVPAIKLVASRHGIAPRE
jgi:hypothetical protein